MPPSRESTLTGRSIILSDKTVKTDIWSGEDVLHYECRSLQSDYTLLIPLVDDLVSTTIFDNERNKLWLPTVSDLENVLNEGVTFIALTKGSSPAYRTAVQLRIIRDEDDSILFTDDDVEINEGESDSDPEGVLEGVAEAFARTYG